MKKLTARNSTFLHNAKLLWKGAAYKDISKWAQVSEEAAYNEAMTLVSPQYHKAYHRAMFAERHASIDALHNAIDAAQAQPAAIAANVSADAATDAWIIENAGADGAELSEPAPDAAQTAAAGDEMAELMYEAGGIIEEAIKMRREKDEQIAQLTRDLEAARTAAAALREALAEMPKYRLGQEVSVGEYSPVIGKVEEIRITDDGIDYSVYVEGESMAYTWSEGKVSPADPDAALASARQRADDGTRHSVADVEAALEAQWAEAWTPKVGDRVRIKADARFDHMNAAAREQIESIRDAHIVGRVIDRALGLVKVDFEGICPNMVAEKLEPEAQS